jgi:hypothetical protein
MSNTNDRQDGARPVSAIDDSVEGHGVKDTGELAPAEEDDPRVDDSVEGHAINERPLDNGGTPLS